LMIERVWLCLGISNLYDPVSNMILFLSGCSVKKLKAKSYKLKAV
jgi:hypothetical protein